ncbi:MAG TPA: TIGR02996 domain-containing protein [Xanthomonadales bacterium]|nr:TIGR02996 domain-containing protein [Xanthomonadales bacterium]
MTTEADLIAAIDAAPDDPAAFLVYADYLQSKGDPRGELITLMHAGDQALADKHLRAHKAAFIGKLASPSIKLEAWRLGFVDHVRLIGDDERHALELVDLIAQHPSTRFVRKLEIHIIGKRRSYAGVDARLVELARPAALAEITFGKPGDHVPSAQLLETFPRVPAPSKKSWPEIVAAVAALRRAGPGFAPQDLVVTNANGLPLPLDAEQLARGLAAEVGGKHRLGLVDRLHEDCTPDMLDRYANSLVTAWRLQGEESRNAWTFDAASVLGGARAARNIAQRFATISHARAVHAVDCLARMRSPLATLELFAASQHWASRGEHAEAQLAGAAKRANIDVLTLLARAGSDPRDAENDDDALARFREIDRAILELLMTTGWSAPLSTVIDLFARTGRAAGLVWRTADALFAFAGGRLVDMHGALELRENPAWLVHVAEPDLDPRTLDAWRTWQLEQARLPPVAQLDRTAPRARTTAELAELVGYETDIDRLRDRGYRNGGLKDSLHVEQQFVRTYLDRGKPYSAVVQPTWGDRRVWCPQADALPPVVAFEVARDLAAAQVADPGA